MHSVHQKTPVHAGLLRGTALGLIGLLGLTACGDGQSPEDPSTTASATAASSDSQLQIEDAWAKAADSGMTSVFGTVVNKGTEPVTVIGGSSVATEDFELHETVQDEGTGATTMREKEGGFTIEPGESLELAPGGNHLMLIGLTCSLQAGNDIQVILRTKEGKALSFTAPIRDYSAAQEHYAPEESSGGDAASEGSGHEGHDHEGHDHKGHEGHEGHDHASGSHAHSHTDAPALPSCSDRTMMTDDGAEHEHSEGSEHHSHGDH